MGESGVLNDSPTDLSPIMSTFMSSNGIRYHLHPELVQEGEGEVISVCVDCLQLIKEEDDAGTIHLDSPDAEVKTEKRNGGSQKLREKTMEEADKFREKDQAMYDVLKGVLRALLIFFCVCRSSR